MVLGHRWCTPLSLLSLLVLTTVQLVHVHSAFAPASASSPSRNGSTLTSSIAASTARSRRLGDGLDCDLQLYHEFINSQEGKDIFIMATMCESRIKSMKELRAGSYGPIEQSDLKNAMCSNECQTSDTLHQTAMAQSRCSCAQVSANTCIVHDFCWENSARLLCTHVGECGHWGCELEDFMCLRNEWDRLHPCDARSLRLSLLGASVAVLTLVLVFAAPLFHGAFPVRWLQQDHAPRTGKQNAVLLNTQHPQLVAVVAQEARKLVESKENAVSFDVVPAALGLEKAVAGPSLLRCVLLKAPPPPPSSSLLSSTEREPFHWLAAKLRRAAFHRDRGNDLFKSGSHQRALHAYSRALLWLACPPNCQFSSKETSQITPLVVACHSNMAMCYYKTNEMDKCIHHSTRALAHDASHVKARFRRAQAYLHTKQYELAVRDLEKLAHQQQEKDDPKNKKLFMTSLVKATRMKQHHEDKQKQAFALAF